ncbi:MAG: tRNA (adenosine(37)-N6)-threonylcarbamoyltransferase complex ATPase subunit type 1 TsaE [Gammaproteobacteria bacterium]|nr:tRNA (adenosine(37)-N6)-threonylcarbamoyltransferase complex ATPase subunit type 1 TsaE [Gammaproteobacteria bacterium]MBT8150195.1 tRNA (adenosine(37)-N6)-threonylcarbamoyltransferase complex ATPase subunit type 1 TsaE [Gammaproteobacteria bacterium]NND38493.1 tRNA (adenosine(37)-N6)-threonylcarbamoyltransferase complex ATPase subunit type 1 TsaE [Pseudomonadales bacterium]NNM11981.1 tRNA (adenosine(37)-N6)-threonylcarbamoyltransferase complex ATPase subunit type 1 TsaE [Pseudomonadales bact
MSNSTSQTGQSGQNSFESLLPDESATISLGNAIANAVLELHRRGALPGQALVIYLVGDLGAGKTTMSRGIVRGLGHSGAVKSPTFTLVEPYALSPCAVYHFDLYRISDAEEFEYIGVDNYFNQHNAVCLLEWPERGEGIVPLPDLTIMLGDSPTLSSSQEHDLNEAMGQRSLRLIAQGSVGMRLLEAIVLQCKAGGPLLQTGAARENRPA